MPVLEKFIRPCGGFALSDNLRNLNYGVRLSLIWLFILKAVVLENDTTKEMDVYE